MSVWETIITEPYIWNPVEERGDFPIKVPESIELSELKHRKSQQKTNGPIDSKELGMRQTYAESGFNPNAHNSDSGAAGVQQIIPKFAPKGFTIQDLYNPSRATIARNIIMGNLNNYSQVTQGFPSDSILYARKLAAYNRGVIKLGQALDRAKSKGVDIDDSWDWIQFLPNETQKYINFILRGRNIDKNRNEESYKRALINKKDIVDIVRKNIR